ncbi:hypothetical protein [Parvibaculum sp.]|uniref:hypothetical protein n=1 Tax=Parvibaculum sp. TaxID=2024848 RepID=UPI00320D48E7
MTRIFIGTPAYGGQVTTAWFHSMRNLQVACQARGIEISVMTLDKESLISRGRNSVVAEFLGREDHSHLLFIDADIGFHPDTVFRLLSLNKPVVGAAYPKKGVNWEKVLKVAKTTEDPNVLRENSVEFAINVFDEDMPSPGVDKPHQIVNGCIRVSKIATGFMLIQRGVFDIMRERFPDKRYTNDITGYENQFSKGNFWSFFDVIIHPETKRYLSEDYGFCYLWTKGCGGEIWCDVSSRMTHFGVYNYSGSFLAGRQPT